MKKLYRSYAVYLMGVLLPAVIVLAQTEQQAAGSSPQYDFKQEEIRRQKQREINAAKHQEANWARAKSSVEKLYAVGLSTVNLSEDELLAVKTLLTERVFVPIDAVAMGTRFPDKPGLVAEVTSHEQRLVDEKIRQLVGDAKASEISQIVRLGGDLAFVQTAYAPGIATQATRLDAKQILALARLFEAFQARYQGETQESLIKLGLQDGLFPMDHAFLKEASQHLTKDQLAALQNLMRERMKKSPIYNQLKKNP